MHWNVIHPSRVTNLEELERVLLQNRKISDALEFFHPTSPLKLTLNDAGISSSEMQKAIQRLQQAHQNQEDVLVFGDYDADGISATAIMWLTLHYLGFKARPFIPHRTKHGYGLSPKAVKEIITSQKPDLLITVDNGIVALEQVVGLKKAKVDVIITDHHQPESQAGKKIFPDAVAVIHTTALCGATVAWMMAKEMITKFGGNSDWMQNLLDLCGLATIADQVPLQNANRSFATFGVEALTNTSRPGIKALCRLSDIDQKKLSVNTVNYVLAPRINAMGRLDHGLDALRLLCTSNLTRAVALAKTLDTTNSKRQTLTEDLLNIAQARAADWQDQSLIVVAAPEFHEGVIGLIAGKLMELYHKPAIVIAVGEVTAKASARSIPNVNIVELIRLIRSDLLEVGGHPMAAGFGFAIEKLETVKTRLLAVAKQTIKPELLEQSVTIDCQAAPSLMTENSQEIISLLEKCQPFGQGNPPPVIGLLNMKILDSQRMGKSREHIKLVLSENSEQNVKTIQAIGWRLADKLQVDEHKILDVAGTLEINEWKGKKSLQIVIKSLCRD